MMGKQVRFFASENDLNRFLEFAENEGFYVLPEISESDEIPEAIPPNEFRWNASVYLFFLMHKTFTPAEAFYSDLLDQSGMGKLMVHASPAIEVQPSTLQNNQLGEGRIYFGCDRNDKRYDEAFGTYKTLERYLRKWSKVPDQAIVVGPDARADAERGHLKLTPR